MSDSVLTSVGVDRSKKEDLQLNADCHLLHERGNSGVMGLTREQNDE